jgi:hypothetical protein
MNESHLQTIRALRLALESGQLCDEQFGFRPRHSTRHQLARLVEMINRKCDYSLVIGAVFLDLAKAFENVRFKSLFR